MTEVTGQYVVNDRSEPLIANFAFRPKGFWSFTVSVIQSRDYKKDGRVWAAPEIQRGSGGEDGTLSSIESAGFLVAALKAAIKIAKKLDKRTGKEIEQNDDSTKTIPSNPEKP